MFRGQFFVRNLNFSRTISGRLFLNLISMKIKKNKHCNNQNIDTGTLGKNIIQNTAGPPFAA